MDTDFSQNNKYTTKIVHPTETTGVERELQRFAMNQYLGTRNKEVLIGTNDAVIDGEEPIDDLLLTNAVTENKVQDTIDKKRYLKEYKSYVTINSGARQQAVTDVGLSTGTNGGTRSSLFTTGDNYHQLFPFAPFVLEVDSNGDPLVIDDEYFVKTSSSNNHIQFRLQDITVPTSVAQVLKPSLDEIFDVYLPSSGEKMTLDQLRIALETNSNIVASTGNPLTNSVDKFHMFTFDVFRHPTINSDRAIVKITCQSNFQYTWIFYSLGNMEATPDAVPIPATDAAFVVQNPDNNFPYPNSYALYLDKAYTNVKSICIISSEIPNTDTTINANNNHITFQLIDRSLPPPTEEDPYKQNIKTSEGLTKWEVYLPLGNYNMSELVAQMDLIINTMIFGETGLPNMFTIVADEITGTFEITTTDPYAFTWNFNPNPNLKWRNLYQMLGFRDSAVKAYTTSFNNLVGTTIGPVVMKKPFRAFRLRKSDVVWLQLNNYETIYDTLTKCKYFCKFNLDNVEDWQFAFDTFTPSIQVFVDIPIPVLNKVDVRLYDEVGMPYNFNGIDHSFTLEITHHIDRLMGTDYSSRRGVNGGSSYI